MSVYHDIHCEYFLDIDMVGGRIRTSSNNSQVSSCSSDSHSSSASQGSDASAGSGYGPDKKKKNKKEEQLLEAVLLSTELVEILQQYSCSFKPIFLCVIGRMYKMDVMH
nr:uncharacterized protein LOC113810182 [Penaeus vannamei]